MIHYHHHLKGNVHAWYGMCTLNCSMNGTDVECGKYVRALNCPGNYASFNFLAYLFP